MTLHVLDPGLHSLLVDEGRASSRSLGVPIGGAADRISLALGNALVGNSPEAVALEMSLSGPVLEATCELACVVFGAAFDISSNRQKLRVGKTATLQPDEQLHIGGVYEGMRAYLCVTGGFESPQILGSRSGLRPIHSGDHLPCRPSRIGRHFVRIDWNWDKQSPRMSVKKILRIVDGPQSDWFPKDCLFPSGKDISLEWVISSSSNRMGLRLEGNELPFPDQEMISEPVCPGSVQVTRDGQCIVLGIDGQTIGGYPKIAQIISADLDRLGQLRPKERLMFQKVTLVEAEQLWRNKQAEVRHWTLRIRTALGNW